MKFQIPKASTSVILTVFIQESSSSTGAGLGSLDQTSSITGGYVKRDGTGVALAVDENVTTEGTYEAPSTAAQVRIGTPANMPAGFYELHFHNDLFTTADWITMGFSGASNMAPLTLEIQLTSVDLNDAVRGGMTALPNAAANAPGGLLISSAGALNMDSKLANTNEVTAVRMAALTDWIDGGRLDVLLDAIPTTAMRGTDSALTDKAGFSLSAAGILAVWHQAMSAVVTAGSVGKLLKDEVTSVRMATLTDWIDGGRLDLLIDAVKAKTDGLTFTGADVKATLDGETVVTDAASRTASQASGFATPGDQMAMSASERNALADAVLSRNVSNVEATAGDHSLCYVVLAMSESNTTANAGKLTVFRTNGVTEFAQKPITTDAAADPITGVQ